MKLEVQNEIEAKLLSRKRIMANASYDGVVPSRKEVTDALAAHYSIKPEQIAIMHIYPQPGTQNARVIAHLYDSVEQKKRLEKVLREPKQEEAKAE
jgi:ribosomal protein S24E